MSQIPHESDPRESDPQIDPAQLKAGTDMTERELSEHEPSPRETLDAEALEQTTAASGAARGQDEALSQNDADGQGEALAQDEADGRGETAADAGVPIEALRIAEAILFASAEPLEESEIARRMPEGVAVRAVLDQLKAEYAPRGVNLLRVNGRWLFRTASDLGWLMSREAVEPRKLSRAALETLAIVAYHQPVTRAEIEHIRGVAVAKGTIDVLLETGWVRMRGRRRAPGRPITYGTTDEFLLHFGLERVGDLPGLDELRGAGLLDGRLPPGFNVPSPDDAPTLLDDEDPLEEGDGEDGELPLEAWRAERGDRDLVEPDESANDVLESRAADDRSVA